jgi:hypothetical protein
VQQLATIESGLETISQRQLERASQEAERTRNAYAAKRELVNLVNTGIMSQLALSNTALEHQRDGIALTVAESAALAQRQTLLREAQNLDTQRDQQITRVRNRLQNEKLETQERIALQRELNDLLGQQAGRQSAVADQGPGRGHQLCHALHRAGVCAG